MTSSRPGRKPIAIPHLTDVSQSTVEALVSRVEALLADTARVPLNERGALSMADTAIYLGVSLEMVKRLKKEGHLTPLKHFGDRILFSREAVDVFVKASHDESLNAA